MNSVSSVACINPAREYVGLELKAAKSDDDTCTSKCERTVVNNGDGFVGDVRFMPEYELDGMVVEISVWISTRANIVLYT